MSGSDFRDLQVRQKPRDLWVQVYLATAEGEVARDFGLRNQIRRAAVGICSNIAEGNDRGSNRDVIRFLFMAKGSAAELISHLEIAHAVGYLEPTGAAALTSSAEEITRMLRGLIKHRTVE